MLNEPASSFDDRPVGRERVVPAEDLHAQEQHAALLEFVGEVLTIDRELYLKPEEMPLEDAMLILSQHSRLVVSFEGWLSMDSEAAYRQLDEKLAPMDMFAMFRERKIAKNDSVDVNKVKHTIHIVQGRIVPKTGRVWPNVVLFILTVLSVLFVGMTMAINEIAATDMGAAQAMMANWPLELWRGLPYAISIMLILGAHEMGHYLVARHHRVAASLPYFIPLPIISPIGTLGAFISLRQPMPSRKTLFDIGVAGPLAGLVVAIPILLIGLATSTVGPIQAGGMLEGNSVLYALAKFFTKGQFLPNAQVDVFVNQLAWAGWTGLLVTALNLIPLGQLDGGHVLYSTFGEQARKLYYPLLGILAFLLLFVSTVWGLMLVLLFLLGRYYAVPLDNITRLDPRRRNLAMLTIGLFLMTFVPVPLSEQGAQNGLLASIPLGITLVVGLSMLRARLR